jgi:2-keto-4-pentenoate hydratase
MKNFKVFLFSIIAIANLVIFFGIQNTKANQKTFSLTKSPNLTRVGGKYDRIAAELANNYLILTPVKHNPNLTLDRSIEVQDRFVKALIPNLGQIVGYKAGLTNKLTQARYNISQPVSGILLEKMLLKNGSVVKVDSGIQLRVEGDLIVRVGSDSINQATTAREALASLDAVIPFIELPDLIYASDVKLDAPALVAINVAARFGVLGEPIPLSPTEEWQERLGKIQLTMLDRSGNELAAGESNALLGHPLNALLWLRDDLQARGKFLKKGDLLSLGTITAPMSVSSKTTIRAQYIGLDPLRLVEVSVSFDD